MATLREIFTEHFERHGTLIPQDVVNEATDPDHPLHDQLEWDDEVAGNAYRCSQVAAQIRSVKVVYREGTGRREPGTVRSWIAAETIKDPRPGYIPTEEVLADPLSQRILLREAQREVTALQRRYGHLVEFADMLRRAAGEETA